MRSRPLRQAPGTVSVEMNISVRERCAFDAARKIGAVRKNESKRPSEVIPFPGRIFCLTFGKEAAGSLFLFRFFMQPFFLQPPE